MIVSSDDDIIIAANEDLFNQSKTQILVYKHKEKQIKISQKRKLISYCWEYCGITGLSYHTLRFQSLGRDIKPDTVVSNSCYLTVRHKAEFALEPPNSLKSSLKGIIVNGDYSDITIRYTKDSKNDIRAHKCILSCRSKKFEQLIQELEKNEPGKRRQLDLTKSIDGKEVQEAFVQMLNFIYSGELVFPDSPQDVFRLIRLASQFEISDLQQMCEDDILYKLDEENVKEMLFLFEESGIVSESSLVKCRSIFIKNFESICLKDDGIEAKMFQFPGLVKNLLLHVSSKKKLRRKVTFMNYEVE